MTERFLKKTEADSELLIAIREVREAEELLERRRLRVYELAGLVSEKEQRKKAPRSREDFKKACGL